MPLDPNSCLISLSGGGAALAIATLAADYTIPEPATLTPFGTFAFKITAVITTVLFVVGVVVIG